MSPVVCEISLGLSRLINIYIGVLLIYAIVSWLPGLRGKWTDYLDMLVEPVLKPLRGILPALGGFDISFLVLLLLLQFASQIIVPRACLLI